MAEHHDAHKKGYEDYHLDSIGPILLGTAGIVSVAVLSFIAMWFMFHGLEQASLYLAETPPPMAAHQKPHDGPLIQAVPNAELTVVRAENQQALTGYGWVDKDAAIVHIPVDRAMDLVIKRGFPVRK